MAGVAYGGTRTLLEQSTGPTLGTTVQPPTATTPGQEDRGRESGARGREDEVRARENEPGEDLRGPCDEAEHADDPRCTGAPVAPTATDDDAADDRGGDRGPGTASGRSGHDGADDHGGSPGPGGDDGGHSGHGGGGGDD